MDGGEIFGSSDDLALVSPAYSPSSLESPIPSPTSHNTLIRVRAQAMTVDDSTGLWKVIKGHPATDLKLSKDGDDCYIITARRLSDRQEQLFSHKLSPNTVYQRGHGAFHHWRTEKQRQGVIFNSQGDARRFERLVRKAITEISPRRASSSEEEIFVKADSLLLEPTTSPLSAGGVPLRPHKPKRLTEEYGGNSSASSDAGEKLPSARSSASSHSPTHSNPGAIHTHQTTVVTTPPITPPPAKTPPPAIRHHQRVSPTLLQHNQTAANNNNTTTSATNSSSDLVGSTSYQSSRVSPPTTMSSTKQPTCTPSSLSLSSTSPNTQKAVSEPSPPLRMNVTSRPTAAARSSYSDYRNDYYIKQEQRRADSDKTVSVSDIDVQDTVTAENDTTSETNLKSLKNTPPLPRKKKRHRGGLRLCCFSSHSSNGGSE